MLDVSTTSRDRTLPPIADLESEFNTTNSSLHEDDYIILTVPLIKVRRCLTTPFSLEIFYRTEKAVLA